MSNDLFGMAQEAEEKRHRDAVSFSEEARKIVALLRRGTPMTSDAIAAELNMDLKFTRDTVRSLYEANQVEDNGTRAKTASYEQAIEWRVR
jgi:transcription initiation factor IIE alpha subunit